ncbi:MAG: flagellar biosynthetic protein FliR [Deltaproteobacteria bacterium]|nr:flagellar biosynthetic protein FliR [Deltaproteobacteria bacterium]
MMNEADIVRVVLGVTRCAAWAHTAPVIGDRVVPARIRAAACVPLGFAISLAWAPRSYDELSVAVPSEILLGLSLGFMARLLFLGIEFGGQLIGVQLGLGFAQSYDALSGEEALATRRIAGVLAGLAFLNMDGLESSVRALSIQGLVERGGLLSIDAILGGGSAVMQAGFRMAGPMLLAGFVANVAVALAARAAPALNAFSVMLALFLLVGGFVLFGTIGTLTQEIESITRMAIEKPLRVLIQ